VQNKGIILEKLYYAEETKHNKNKRRYYNHKIIRSCLLCNFKVKTI